MRQTKAAQKAAAAAALNLQDYVNERVEFCPTTSCHIWVGGYGGGRPEIGQIAQTAAGLSTRYATHLVWFLEKGETVPENALICHTCDTVECVAPHHLYRGTHLTNTGDMIRRGRRVNGMLGKKHTAETRQAYSLARKGRRLSSEHIEKMRRPKSPEHVERMRAGALLSWARRRGEIT